MLKQFTSLLAFLGLVAFVPQAKASMDFTLNQNECCANVNLQQLNASTVQVTVSLTPGEFFAATGNSNHPGFAFNLSGDPAINVTNITAGFTAGSGSSTTNGPNFGTFDYFLNAPGTGTSAQDAGPLTFDVSLQNSGALSESSFVANSKGYYFVADILGQNGKTGLSGGNSPGTVSTVPEPSSIALFGTVLSGCAFFLRKRSII